MTTNDLTQLTFEQAYTQLEDIVARLNSEDLPLEDALNLFERGQSLATRCQQLLDEAELKVQQATGDDGELADFDPGT